MGIQLQGPPAASYTFCQYTVRFESPFGYGILQPEYDLYLYIHTPSLTWFNYRKILPKSGRGLQGWFSETLESMLQSASGVRDDIGYYRGYMGGCQNYGPFLGPYYNTAPNI